MDFQPYDSNTNIQLSNEQQLKQLNSNIVEVSENNSLPLHGDLYQLIQNFNNMNTREPADQNVNNFISSSGSVIVGEILNIINNSSRANGTNDADIKQNILNCLNNHNVNSQEIYNWLLSNQNDSNSIMVLGFYNHFGIGISINNQKAFELFQKAANIKHIPSIYILGTFYEKGIGTGINNQKDLNYIKRPQI